MNAGDMILNVLIQKQALATAASGNPTGIVIVAVYVMLLAASITALAVVIERSIRLRRKKLTGSGLLDTLPELVGNGDLDKAISLCKNSTTAVSDILADEFAEIKNGIPVEEVLETSGDAIEEKFYANLDILGTIARIAPLLGLLGTVLGMMYAFSQLDAGMRKETLAQGITAALDTTVRGLIIAIFCVSFEHFFVRRIRYALNEYGAAFTRIIRLCRRGTEEGDGS